MELKVVLDSKYAFGGSEASVQRSYSSSALTFRDMVNVRFSPKHKHVCSSCRGPSVKASYSRTSNLSNGVVTSALESSSFFIETHPYYINGTNNGKISWESRGILDACDDEYGGIIVNADKLPTDPDIFASMLMSSLAQWKLKGKKGIWLKLPSERVELVPVAVKKGFQYHHAESGYVMLTYWIPNEPCMLPANASHQVGVGGFVMNDNNEVLVVQETYCSPTFTDLWKLPTGFILESEEIYEGAVREVKEETGIDSEFVEVIAFRHAHNVAFEKSDLFFICMLRPLSTKVMVDDREIQAAKWMPLEEFIEQPLIRGDRMFKKIMDICIARLGRRYCGLHPHQVVSKFDGKESTLYYNVVESHRSSNCETTDEMI